MTYFEQKQNGMEHVRRYTSLGLNFSFHFHNAYELVYVRDGALDIVLDSRTRRLVAGDAYLIFPGQIHGIHTADSSVAEIISFSPDVVERYHEKHRGMLPATAYLRIGDLALIDRLAFGEDELLFVSDLYRLLADFDRDRRYKKNLRASTSFAMKILNYVDAHYKENITLAGLADFLGYDYNYLSGCIAETFHTGFPRLVNEFRIGHACHLLRKSELTAAEIAEECGYACLRSFNRNFRALVGTTPTAYRNGDAGEAHRLEDITQRL